MNEETNNLIAESYLGNGLPRDFADWAVYCLENGFDTKNLRILASIYDVKSLNENDVELYFKLSLVDLGFEFPSIESCLIRYSKFIAVNILERKIDTFEGCSLIDKVYNTLNSPKGLSNWNFLSYMTDEWTDEQMNNAIFVEAERRSKFEGTFQELSETEFAVHYTFHEKVSLLSKFWKKLL